MLSGTCSSFRLVRYQVHVLAGGSPGSMLREISLSIVDVPGKEVSIRGITLGKKDKRGNGTSRL